MVVQLGAEASVRIMLMPAGAAAIPDADFKSFTKFFNPSIIFLQTLPFLTGMVCPDNIGRGIYSCRLKTSDFCFRLPSSSL